MTSYLKKYDGDYLTLYSGDKIILPSADAEVFGGIHLDDWSDSTQIDVYCDGFGLRFKKANDVGSYLIELHKANFTQRLAWSYDYIHDGSNGYYLGYDDKRTYEILERTSQRVIIRIAGNFDRTSGSTDDYLSNSTRITMLYTIYRDRYTVDWEWEVSGSVTVSSSIFAAINGSTSALTNENSVYGTSSESSASNSTAYNSYNYLGFTSDQINVVLIELYDSDSIIDKYNAGDGVIYPRTTYDPTGADTFRFSYMYIIDSVDRAGGKQYDSSALRIALGYQYTDTSIGTMQRGSAVSDLYRPISIGTSGLAGDGAWHFQGEHSKGVKIPWDRTRYNPAIVIHDFPITTVDEKNILHTHVRMNDNESSSIIVAEKGLDADWQLINSPYTLRNTDNDAVTDRIQGSTALDSKDLYCANFPLTNVSASNVDICTVIAKVKPQFIFTAPLGNQGILTIGYSMTDYIYLKYDEINKSFMFRRGISGSYDSYNTTDETSNNRHQQWHTLWGAFDVNKKIVTLFIDGVRAEVISRSTIGTCAGTPTKFHIIGYQDGANEGDFYVDEIKFFNKCILPYGAIATNYELYGHYGMCHSDTTFYWACESATVEYSAGDSAPTTTGSPTYATTDPIYGSKHLDMLAYNTTNHAFDVSNYDILDPRNCTISMWVNPQSTPASNWWCFGYGGLTGVMYSIIQFGIDTTVPAWRFKYFASEEKIDMEDTTAVTVGRWYHLCVRCADVNHGGFITMEVDGVRLFSSRVTKAFDYPSGTMYINAHWNSSSGGDYFIDQIHITNSAHTPMIPTVFGKPIIIPQMKIDGELGRLGTDYEVTHTPDLSFLVTKAGNVTA